jgi:hypothetical protein
VLSGKRRKLRGGCPVGLEQSEVLSNCRKGEIRVERRTRYRAVLAGSEDYKETTRGMLVAGRVQRFWCVSSSVSNQPETLTAIELWLNSSIQSGWSPSSSVSPFLLSAVNSLIITWAEQRGKSGKEHHYAQGEQAKHRFHFNRSDDKRAQQTSETRRTTPKK